MISLFSLMRENINYLWLIHSITPDYYNILYTLCYHLYGLFYPIAFPKIHAIKSRTDLRGTSQT